MTEIRRVLTGEVGGLSCVVDDRNCGFFPFVPGVELCELWHESASPVDLKSLAIEAPQFPLMTKPGQVAARIVRFLPFDAATKEAENAILKASGQATTSEGLHRTATFEYYVVRKGCIHLVVENGEVEVREGDHVILMGGYHSWENRTDELVELFSIMLGATSDGDPASIKTPAIPEQTATQSRKIVAGNNEKGQSAILINATLDTPASIGDIALVHSLWLDSETPPSNRFMGDISEPGMPAPPRHQGTSLWQVTVNPGAAGTNNLRRHDTVDFIIITQGEIVYVSEREDVLLRAGDIIVQKGNRHSWRNDTSDISTFSVVHVGIETQAS